MLVNEICLGRGKEDEGVILLHCLSFPITGPEQKGRWQAGHTCPHVPPFLGLLQDLTTAALTPTLTVAWTRRCPTSAFHRKVCFRGCVASVAALSVAPLGARAAHLSF